MKTVSALIKRNVKLFFKDKAMFFTSLITPVILLILYATFLGNVYRDSFVQNIPNAADLPEKLMNGLVGGQLISSILSVSCVTVAFCANFISVQDKATGVMRDLYVSPVKTWKLALSYCVSSVMSTFIICFTAMIVCLIYVAAIGWYMSVADVLLLLLDVVLLLLFGISLSSVINFFLSTQGQISAVGSMVSSCYGFISGAYMPISSFGEGLQIVISFLPGTYGTALLRSHAMNGAFEGLKSQGVPNQAIDILKDSLDCNVYFFENKVSVPVMYAVLCGAVIILFATYVLLNIFAKKAKK